MPKIYPSSESMLLYSLERQHGNFSNEFLEHTRNTKRELSRGRGRRGVKTAKEREGDEGTYKTKIM